MLGVVLFWGLIIAALVWVSRLAWDRVGSRGERGSGPETPLDILQRRYARGEIGKEEFEEKRKDLQ
jgi:putative membrane protein